MIFFSSLIAKCNVKLIDYHTVDDRDPSTLSRNTRVICYIESEHAWCDSGDAVCFTREAAREEAAKRFLAMLKMAGGDDREINNLATRSTSPAATSARKQTICEVPLRARSASPPVDEALLSPRTRQRRNSVLDSMKSFLARKKSKSPRQ